MTAALVLLLLASISGGHTDGDNVEPEYDDDVLDDEEVSEEDLPPPEQRLSVKVTYPRQESLVFSELMWVTLLVENVKLPNCVVHITKKATGEELAKFDVVVRVTSPQRRRRCRRRCRRRPLRFWRLFPFCSRKCNELAVRRVPARTTS